MFLGSFISYGTLRYQKFTEDVEQRKKVLRLVLKEIDLNLGVKKGFYSRRLRTGNMILENPLFDIERYEKIIELTFEAMRRYDQLTIALEAMMDTHGKIISNVSTPTIPNVLLYQIQKFLGLQTTQEIAATSLPEQMANKIDDDSNRIKKVLGELRSEISFAIQELSKPLSRWNKFKIILGITAKE